LRPDLVILHYTAMTCAEGAIRHLCSADAQVSAHYVIAAGGTCTQLVPEEARAWHAGAAHWGGEGDVNSRSIGIELANDGFQPFPEPQMAALETLLAGIMARWDIPPKGIIGHSDVSPGRKVDPGRRFDWKRLADQGLAVWPEPVPPSGVASFRADLARAGYSADVEDATILAALRLRLRPWADGPMDATDRALAAGLARAFPVDAARRDA
jgi:N-acetylmuramoyl-L-alanine amidase